MDTDFPAAHSMDSSWYAVDKHGNVALFVTGAGGAMPNDAYSPEAAELMEELDDDTRAEIGAATDDFDSEHLPDRRHLFVYKTGTLDECLAERYHREQTPKTPLHVDQLPPEVRQAVKRMRFEDVDFTTTDIIQPCDLTECGTWDPAYLAADGNTVRPVPGREGEYARIVEALRNDLGGDGLTFEEPKQKHPRRGKKKGDEDGR